MKLLTPEANRLQSTDRLILRPPELSDQAACFAIHADPMTNRFNPHGPATSDSSDAMLREWIAHWEQSGFGYWAIALRDAPSDVIGFGGIVRKHVADRPALNLYFRFAPGTWGKGLASEMATAALSFAFDTLQEQEVRAKVRVDNLPSRKVLERMRMSIVDEIEDVPAAAPSLIYAISAAEWNAK